MNYNAYIRSAHWRQSPARREAFHRAGGRCQLCNGPNHLEAHHRTYTRLGAERPEDLTILGFFAQPPKKVYSRISRARSDASPHPHKRPCSEKIPCHREAVIAVHALGWVMTFKSDYAHSLAAMPRSSSPMALA